LQDIIITNQSEIADYYSAIEIAAGPDRVFWDDVLCAWIITGYDECVALLDNKSVVRSKVALPRDDPDREDLIEFAETVLSSQMMFISGEDAANRRRLWINVLNRAPVDVVRCNPEKLAAEMLASIDDPHQFDAYRSLLQPFVSRVICSKLGIDEEERNRLYPFIMQYAGFLDGKLREKHAVHAAYVAIASLYASLAGRGELLPEVPTQRHEYICDYVLTLTAGHESAAYLLGTALIFAGGESGYLAAAGTDRSRIQRIIREASRVDSPVQMIGRQAQEDISIGSRFIKAGDRLLLHIGVANRDRRTFDNPRLFDPERSGPSVLAFGMGTTKCIGHRFALDECVAFCFALAHSERRLDVDLTGVTRVSGLGARSFAALPASLI
jgi:cytochrome P450